MPHADIETLDASVTRPPSALRTLCGHLRASARLLATVLITGLSFLALQAVHFIGLFAPSLGQSGHDLLMRGWARSLIAVYGIRVEVRGTPPTAPCLLVGNHVSYIDILTLFAHAEGHFLAKAELARWPLLGFIARSAGTMFIDRTRKSDVVRAISAAETHLRAGRSVFVFPEGQTTDGSHVKPFKPSLFQVAVRTDTPVATVTMHYATNVDGPPTRTAVCWWGDMGFPGHLYRLWMLPGFRATLTFGSEILAGDDRKQLALRAHHAVERHFVEL